MQVTVYILRCADGSYYVGLTKQAIEVRVWEHNEGIYKGYTHSRRPVVLMHTELYESINQAIDRERQLKRWSRKKKEALIRYDYDGLVVLSRNRQGSVPATSSFDKLRMRSRVDRDPDRDPESS